MPHRPGLGKSLSECRTLHEVAEYTRLAERAETQGITQGLDTRCPHCLRKFAVSLIDGLIMVPDGPGDPVSAPGRTVECPHAHDCGKQFKLTPKKGYHLEVWP